MRKLIHCITISVLLNTASMPFFGVEAAWYLNTVALNATIAVWLWYAFSECDNMDIHKRSILGMAFLWQSMDSIYNVFDWLYPDLMVHTWAWWLIACILWFIYVACRGYDYESDEITPGNVHILLWHPRKDKSVIFSTVGRPFGSVAIYAFDRLWTYRWKEDSFVEYDIEYPGGLEKNYLVIDTGVSENKDIELELMMALGTKARRWQTLWTRNGCVCTIRGALKAMGKEFTPHGIEYIPSFYAKKLIKMKEK